MPTKATYGSDDNRRLHTRLNDRITDTFTAFQQGEEQGYNYYFHLYYKPLLHFAHSIVHNQEMAEDVTEDSLIKFWEKRESISSEAAIKPYLFTSVKNACINILRKQKNHKAYQAYIQKQPLNISADITQKMITVESMHQVYLALQNLPSKYRKIFTMHWVEGKEVKDISRELKLPLSTVKSQKARTLELIKKQLPHLGILLILSSLHFF